MSDALDYIAHTMRQDESDPGWSTPWLCLEEAERRKWRRKADAEVARWYAALETDRDSYLAERKRYEPARRAEL